MLSSSSSTSMRSCSLMIGRLGPFRPRMLASVFTPTTSRSPCARANWKYFTCPRWMRSKQPLVKTIEQLLRQWLIAGLGVARHLRRRRRFLAIGRDRRRAAVLGIILQRVRVDKHRNVFRLGQRDDAAADIFGQQPLVVILDAQRH